MNAFKDINELRYAFSPKVAQLRHVGKVAFEAFGNLWENDKKLFKKYVGVFKTFTDCQVVLMKEAMAIKNSMLSHWAQLAAIFLLREDSSAPASVVSDHMKMALASMDLFLAQQMVQVIWKSVITGAWCKANATAWSVYYKD